MIDVFLVYWLSFCLFVVPQPLVELHVKLLRKLGKSVTSDRWEKYLVKVNETFRTLVLCLPGVKILKYCMLLSSDFIGLESCVICRIF